MVTPAVEFQTVCQCLWSQCDQAYPETVPQSPGTQCTAFICDSYMERHSLTGSSLQPTVHLSTISVKSIKEHASWTELQRIKINNNNITNNFRNNGYATLLFCLYYLFRARRDSFITDKLRNPNKFQHLPFKTMLNFQTPLSRTAWTAIITVCS